MAKLTLPWINVIAEPKDGGVLSISVGALFSGGPDWATYEVLEGRAQLRIITLGEHNESFAQVLFGVKAGDQMILYPSDLVAERGAVGRSSGHYGKNGKRGIICLTRKPR